MSLPPPSCARSAWPVALAAGLALAHVRLAAAEAPATPTPSTALEVEMDPNVPEGELLAEWVYQESTAALAALGPAPGRQGTIRVGISGDLYDYEVTVTTIRDGSAREESVAWPCQCTHDEMLVGIRTEVQAAARELEVDPHARRAKPAPAATKWSPFRALGLRGKLGLGLLAGGAATTIAGSTLLGLGDRTAQGDPNYQVAGVPVVLTGIGLLATGTTLFVLEQRALRRRRALAHAGAFAVPIVRGAGVGIAGKF